MNRCYFAVTMFTAILIANVASAQRGPGGGGGAAGILMIESVQKELNITEDQKTKLRESMMGQRGNFQGLQDLSAEDRRKKMDEISKKFDETVKGILDATQQERFSQLRLQREGGAALARAEVAEKLSLTQEQKDQVAKIQQESAPAGGGGGFRDLSDEDRQKAFTEMREKREKANASLLALLTAEQKATFEKLQGAKFEFPAPQRGGRPRDNN